MTYRALRCLGCDAPDLARRAAITAPFVAARVFQRLAAVCDLAHCPRCGLIFFVDRYEPIEAARLYADYRGEGYYQERHHWEPWYSRAFNAGLGGAEEMRGRRTIYANMLCRHAEDDIIKSVLDYGGDRGQLMHGGPGRNHFVFDISDVEPEAGVTSLSAASLAEQKFDLVLLCEVLEHVSEPMQLLRDVLNHVRPGGLLYITVPDLEFPFSDIPAGTWYQHYLKWLLKSSWLTLLADFWSTGYKVKFSRIPPLGFAKMHEHVNFFKASSLEALLQRAGVQLLEVSTQGRGLIALCRAPDSI